MFFMGDFEKNLIADNKTFFLFVHTLLFAKNQYQNVFPNFNFMFHIDTLKLAKLVLSNIPIPYNFKVKTIFEFLHKS